MKMRPTKQNGVVLIIALLFTTVLTLLALSILQKGLLESRMTSYISKQDIDLAELEKDLIKEEEKIKSTISSNKVTEISSLEITKDLHVCGFKFYRAKVTKINSGIIAQSTYAIENKDEKCDPKPNVKAGRQSWFTGKIAGVDN